MIEKIELLPDIPDALKLAAQLKIIVPFIGAGYSNLAGYPSWKNLASKTLEYLANQQLLNLEQVYQMEKLHPRVILSIALGIEKKHKIQIDFTKIISTNKTEKVMLCRSAIENLAGISSTIITTNYDDLLDKITPVSTDSQGTIVYDQAVSLSKKILSKKEDLTTSNIGEPNTVFHIHGSINDRESMVLSTSHYLERYASHRLDGATKANNENRYLSFLTSLFSTKCVLFVGYGLEELEILEFVVEKSGLTNQNKIPEQKHYAVMGFYSSELSKARILEEYLSQFRIGLIPYSKDVNGYDQLINVVNHLATLTSSSSAAAMNELIELEELLK
jgi:SIR2-like domain